jgi:hypothetical protein
MVKPTKPKNKGYGLYTKDHPAVVPITPANKPMTRHVKINKKTGEVTV